MIISDTDYSLNHGYANICIATPGLLMNVICAYHSKQAPQIEVCHNVILNSITESLTKGKPAIFL